MANTKLPARLLDTSAIPALNVTGDLTVDTTTLKVDSTNNRVGIGITAPTAKLHVDAPGTTAVSLTGGAAAGQIFTNEDFEFAFGLHSSAPYPLYIQGRTASSSSTTARDIAVSYTHLTLPTKRIV